MKTSLAIILAVAALISGATVEPKSGHGFGANFGAGLVHKRLPTAAKSGANRPTSQSVSRDRDASRSLIGEAGWQSFDHGGPRCGD